MKKVLFVAGKMVYGGLETTLMNYFRNIDKTKVHMDFMLNYDEKGVYDEEIEQNGGKIFIMPRLKPQNLFKYIKAVDTFFKEHKGEYDIVHGNITSVGIIYLSIAKKYGVKTRIIHAHYANVVGNHYEKIERIMLKPLKYCANVFFACSDKAGMFCFGNKIKSNPNYQIIKNSIDITRFSYNEEKRMHIRKMLHIENKFAILHVGRFESEKNHTFILEMFCQYCKTRKDAVLIFVGDGSLKDTIMQKSIDMKLNDKILFLGLRSDVNDIMQSSDVMILPSIFEGLPMVGIEGQASGLKCLFSDNVTTEVDITGNCEFLPITLVAPWINAFETARNFQREKTDSLIVKSGYEIKAQAKHLQNFYLNAYKDKVVHISQSMNKGGAEKLILNLCISMCEKYNITVICQYHEIDSSFLKILNDHNVKVVLLDKTKGLSIKAFVELYRTLSQIKPQIVHTHIQSAIYALPWYFFHRKCAKIHTIHSVPAMEFTGFHKVLQYINYHIMNVTPVTLCETLQKEAMKIYHLKEEQCPIIPNTIDTKLFKNSNRELGNEITLVNVANFSIWKNQKMLVHVLNMLRKNYKLVFVGDGIEKGNVQKMVKDMNLDNRVQFLGSVADVSPVLKESDIFVLSSTFEGIPLSVIEAFASGMPVVATKVGGMVDLVAEDENGYLVEVDDYSAMAEKIKYITQNKEQYNRISKNNVDKSNLYDIDTIADKYDIIYKNEVIT